MPWGGHPQGAPLPIAFSRRYALGRAPTRGAPTNCLLQAFCPGEGTHKGRPYQLPSLGVMPWGGHPQGAPLPIAFSQAFCPGEGTHKGRPYQLPSLGVMLWGGHPQGAPLPIAFSRRYGLGRAPTRGAPTNCLLSALCPGEGTHKGRPYQLPSLGVLPWGGHPQGVPLPIVFSRRYALGRAPTRGAPTNCLVSALCPGEGTHKGCPYRCLVSALCPGEGTHKGCPYQLPCLGVMPWGGHPQGAPLPIAFSRRYALGRAFAFSRRCALGRAPTRGAPTNCLLSGVLPWGGHPQGAPLPIVFSRRFGLGRAPTRGAPTNCLLQALCPGEGTHKGRPYGLSSLGVLAWGGHPQGVPLPIVFSRRFALGRAPTRGAPTDCLLQALCPGEGTHKGRPYQLPSPGVLPWGGHPQGAPLPIAFSRRFALGRAPTRGAPTNCLLQAFCPGEGTHKGRPYQLPSLGVMPWGGHPQGAPLPIAFSRRFALGRAPTRGAPTNCLL